jgi:hypothetical protein
MAESCLFPEGKDPFPKPGRVPEFDPKPTTSGCTGGGVDYNLELAKPAKAS